MPTVSSLPLPVKLLPGPAKPTSGTRGPVPKQLMGVHRAASFRFWAATYLVQISFTR